MRFTITIAILIASLAGQGGAQKPKSQIDKLYDEWLGIQARRDRRAAIVQDLIDTKKRCGDNRESAPAVPAECDLYDEKVKQIPIDTFIYPSLKTHLAPADVKALKKAFAEVAVDAYNQGAAGR
jgi:hypothetical protein